MLKKASLIFYALFLSGLVAWQTVEISASSAHWGNPVPVNLSRGPFSVLDFPSKTSQTRAIILFGSGDGGWSDFEEVICLTLQKQGYEVIGIDSNAYAKTDYDLATLQADMDTIAQSAKAAHSASPPPVILGGWSMGAAQAIAAAGGPNPPARLEGLVVLDPLSRGRYGLRLADQANLLPTGPGTFGVEDFAKTMGNLHVVQWHADLDSIDSRAWLGMLEAPHREFNFAQAGHSYAQGRAKFLQQLVDSILWISNPGQTDVSTTTGSVK